MDFTIIELDSEHLEAAIDLNERIFKNNRLPRRSFMAALKPSYADIYEDMKNFFNRRFWLAVKDAHVIGTLGLYETVEDSDEADWLNWFCVDPDHQKNGIGHALLNKAITNAQKDKKRYLRLWTTNSETEKAAQKLYDKYAFEITRRENVNEQSYSIVFYREKIL